MDMLREIAPQVWHFQPTLPSPRHFAIVAGLHGDETGPVEVLRELSVASHSFWDTCPHQVTLLLANPGAIAYGHRNAKDGSDFNRSFGANPPTFEAETERIKLIKAHLTGVEALLDLHQTHLPIAPCAVCPPQEEHLRLARRVGAHQAVTGAQSAFLGGMLIDWANRRGILALTLETGQIGDPRSKEVALAAIKALVFEEPTPSPNFQVWTLVEPLRAKAEGYRWTQDWENGSRVSPGTVIATSMRGELCATVEGALFLPKLGVSAGEVCVLQAVLHSRQSTSTRSHIPPT